MDAAHPFNKRRDTWLFFRLGLAELLLLLTIAPRFGGNAVQPASVFRKNSNQFIAIFPVSGHGSKPTRKDPTRSSMKRVNPIFLYSERRRIHWAAGCWKPERFFCIMGRAAAAVAIIQQRGRRHEGAPVEMPM